MRNEEFRTSLNVEEAYDLLSIHMGKRIVHKDTRILESGQTILTLLLEKYYLRALSSISCLVIIDDLESLTHIKSITTKSSILSFISFNFGAAKHFLKSISKPFEPYKFYRID
jgi:hypothetical protein